MTTLTPLKKAERNREVCDDMRERLGLPKAEWPE